MKELCPKCGNTSNLKKKLILLETAWADYPGSDPREKCALGLRVDQVIPEALGEPPLEQFVNGFYCADCGIGFVSEDTLKEGFHPCM